MLKKLSNACAKSCAARSPVRQTQLKDIPTRAGKSRKAAKKSSGFFFCRQIENARADALNDLDLVRLMIGQALTLCAPDRLQSPRFISPAKGCAAIVTKIKLGEVTVQVLLATVLVNAFHAALED